MIATLTGRRLSRIAEAARAIGDGDFDVTLSNRFPDEVGSLAYSIEGMKRQLRDSVHNLKAERNRLGDLLDRLNEGVVMIDQQLTIVYANRRARELVLANASGFSALGLSPTNEVRLRSFAQSMFGSPTSTDLRLADGDRVLSVSGVPVVDRDTFAILAISDESTRERSERAQREFSANAAHELRTPVTSIVTAVEMLEAGAKNDPEMRDQFLAAITREAARLTRLTRALLVLARAEAHEEPVKLARVPAALLLDSVAASLTPNGNVSVVVDCEPALEVWADPDLLEQALSGIATNAAKYTSTGTITFRGRHENGYAILEVADTGTGISEGDQSRAFDRFSTLGDGRGGFGLGLSIARQTIRLLGGQIDLISSPHIGTTVRLTLATSEPEETK